MKIDVACGESENEPGQSSVSQLLSDRISSSKKPFFDQEKEEE